MSKPVEPPGQCEALELELRDGEWHDGRCAQPATRHRQGWRLCATHADRREGCRLERRLDGQTGQTGQTDTTETTDAASTGA